MVIEVSPLVHIEVVVPDAEKAYQFLHNIFGAQRVEKDLAENLSSIGLVKAIHVQLGNLVIQFIEPTGDDIETTWSKFLKEKGPGVHNITFRVKDVKEAAKTFKKEGVSTEFKFRVDWKKLLNPEDLREKAPRVYMIGGEDIVGFKFELSENPWKEDKVPEGFKIKSSYDLKR
ncbi:MAG: hypothetical protein GF311_24130 [Candidatus Lokiarchaeota archaeon]|nr:hypothetical protein [Candidatus Lokiarchaeota archaeon]